jgi:hypothetical protein
MAAWHPPKTRLLVTTIEDSTRLWESGPEMMRTAQARHDQLLRQSIEAGGGYVFKAVVDGFCVPDSIIDAVARNDRRRGLEE